MVKKAFEDTVSVCEHTVLPLMETLIIGENIVIFNMEEKNMTEKNEMTAIQQK